jgi:hypothetical protein
MTAPGLAYAQAFQHLLHEPRFEVTGLVTVQVSRDSNAAEVGHQGITTADVIFRTLSEADHGD